ILSCRRHQTIPLLDQNAPAGVRTIQGSKAHWPRRTRCFAIAQALRLVGKPHRLPRNGRVAFRARLEREKRPRTPSILTMHKDLLHFARLDPLDRNREETCTLRL